MHSIAPFHDLLLGLSRLNDFDDSARISRTDAAYTIEVDVPGIPSSAIKVEVKDGCLRLEAKAATRELNRSWKLPDSVDIEGVTAVHSLGVLTLSLPQKEEAKPRTIEVKIRGDLTG